MKVYKNPFFIFPCIVFWINQYIEKKLCVFIPFVHSYLDDLMAMPVVLGLALQVYRWIHPLKDRFVFTQVQIWVAVAYYTFIFEIMLPIWSATYIMDPWDVFYYILGAIWFYFLINKKQ
jgi:hypothetical protein